MSIDWEGQWKRIAKLYGQDVAQTTLMKVWQKVESGVVITNPHNYIGHAARMEWLQGFRSAGLQNRLRAQVSEITYNDTVGLPTQLRRAEALEEIHRALQQEPRLWEMSSELTDRKKPLNGAQRSRRRRARLRFQGLPE